MEAALCLSQTIANVCLLTKKQRKKKKRGRKGQEEAGFKKRLTANTQSKAQSTLEATDFGEKPSFRWVS